MLKEKMIIITGADGQIGRAIGRLVVLSDANIVVNDIGASNGGVP